jgi:predicted transcriptional regulator of viral defense system
MRGGQKRAIELFRRSQGVLTTSEARRRGVHQRDLYALRDLGLIEPLSRGVFRLTELPPLGDPDLVTVALAVPKAVVALISALHFHGLTTEIPREVSVALPRGTRTPRLSWPPLRVYHMSGEMFSFGIEEHEQDGATLRVYGAAKTVADCFRFRNRLGIDVAVEALRTALAERRFTPAQLMHAARVCRVERVIRPYLEALR